LGGAFLDRKPSSLTPNEKRRIAMATTYRTKGVSLVKGPVGLIGLVLLAYGVTALIFGGHGFGQHAPNGAVYGKTWLGLEVNGWSGLLFIAAGLLLLLGAPLHFTAKGVSLLVGIALGAIAVIAVIKGHGALGLFAGNHLSEIVWGAAAVLLVGLSLLPRVGAKTKRRYDAPGLRDDGRGERLGVRRRADRGPGTLDREPLDRERVSPRTAPVERRSVPTNGAGNGSITDADLPRRRASAPVNGASNGGSVNGDPVTNPDASTTVDHAPRSTTKSTQNQEDQHV
jgi:hypothetical protein